MHTVLARVVGGVNGAVVVVGTVIGDDLAERVEEKPEADAE